MKSWIKALALVAMTSAWAGIFACVIFPKESRLDYLTEVLLLVLVVAIPLFLIVFGFRVLKGQQRNLLYKALLFPAFVISLLPAAILLCLMAVLLFVPARN
jgi:hypothetical protein